MKEVINLDADLSEHFTFIVEGHTYKFRYPTVEEAEKIRELANGDDGELKSMEYIMSFISSEGDAPEFNTIYKKMIIPKQQRFAKMLVAELSGGEDRG